MALTMDRISTKELVYSSHGYVIMEDGTIYTLTKQWYHGVALAILFPDKAKAAGYLPPEEEPDVFHYQRFELDSHNDFPVIRICPSRMITPPSINKGKKPATKEQLEAIRAVFKVLGLKARDIVNTDYSDTTVAQCYQLMNMEHGSDAVYKFLAKVRKTRDEDDRE